MNSIKLYLALSIAGLLLISCGQTATKNKTYSGLEYVFHEDTPGDLIQEGDLVYYDMEIVNDKNEIVQSYRDMPQKPSMRVPKNEISNIEKNPILELMYLCSVGDSIGLIVPADSIPNKLPTMKDSKYFEYRMVVSDVETAAEVLEKEKLAVAKQEEVKSFVEATLTKFRAGELDSEMKSGAGLQYIIHEEGTGDKIMNGDKVAVSYYGCLYDGSMFDNSFGRGRPYDVTVGTGSVIDGWDKGLALLNRGTKATLFIPYTMAYGAAGRPPKIPQKSDLAFYMEIAE